MKRIFWFASFFLDFFLSFLVHLGLHLLLSLSLQAVPDSPLGLCLLIKSDLPLWDVARLS